MDGSQPDILIDDADSGVTASSDWKRHERAGGYGLSYYETVRRGTASEDAVASVRYDAVIPSDGEYVIYASQPVRGNFTSLLSVDVEYGGTVHPVSLPRSEMKVEGQTSTTWAEIGRYDFVSGTEVAVSITDRDADGPVRADAVLFVKCN